MPHSYLERRPTTKREWKQSIDDLQRMASEAGEAKRRANVNGTGSEVQPYIDRMHEINNVIESWYDRYDSIYSSLPE